MYGGLGSDFLPVSFGCFRFFKITFYWSIADLQCYVGIDIYTLSIRQIPSKDLLCTAQETLLSAL